MPVARKARALARRSFVICLVDTPNVKRAPPGAKDGVEMSGVYTVATRAVFSRLILARLSGGMLSIPEPTPSPRRDNGEDSGPGTTWICWLKEEEPQMNNVIFQAVLWLAAGVVLVLLLARRRKRKSM